MTEHVARVHSARLGARFHFARHVAEMFVAMMVGMPLGRALFAAVFGSGSDAALHRHPVAWLLLMAASMTIPMVGWMLYRGHSRRSSAEMAAAMLVPALPFVGLKLGHVVAGPVSGAYMSASTVAMVALIVYRRREYQAAAEPRPAA